MICTKSKDTWAKYINNQLSSTEMAYLEDHLAHCDSCLQNYEELLVTQLQSEVAHTLEIPDLTNKIMKRIGAANYQHDAKQIRHNHVKQTKHMFVHYAIAASIAFILFQLGMFDQFVALSGQTQQVPEQTSQFLDALYTQPIEWFQKLNFLQERSQS